MPVQMRWCEKIGGGEQTVFRIILEGKQNRIALIVDANFVLFSVRGERECFETSGLPYCLHL